MTTLILALSASIALAQTPASTPPATEPAAPAPAESTPMIVTEARVQPPPKAMPGAGDDKIADSDALLAALETAGATISTLTADLVHTNKKSDLEAGQEVRKFGKLMYRSGEKGGAAVGARMFQIDFTEIEFNDKRHAEDQSFIFDGQWLVEKQPKNKQMFKYQVAPPGQVADPLAIGEGPFPLPIGQKRDRILERFHATLMKPDDGFPAPIVNPDGTPNPKMAWVLKTYQVRLIPKPGAREARDFQEVRLWYDKDDLLPRFAKTVKIDDSSDEILLREVKLNGAVAAGAFDTATPSGWDVQIEEFRGAGGANAGAEKAP